MADRFQHDDSVKAQDVTLSGKRLQRARKGRKGHEASRHAERGEADRDKSGIVAKRASKVAEAAEGMAGKSESVKAGSYS